MKCKIYPDDSVTGASPKSNSEATKSVGAEIIFQIGPPGEFRWVGQVVALVDTGCEASMAISWPILRRLGLAEIRVERKVTGSLANGDELPVDIVRVDLRLNTSQDSGIILTQVPIAVFPEGEVCLVGRELLGLFDCTFQNGRFTVVAPGKRFNTLKDHRHSVAGIWNASGNSPEARWHPIQSKRKTAEEEV